MIEIHKINDIDEENIIIIKYNNSKKELYKEQYPYSYVFKNDTEYFEVTHIVLTGNSYVNLKSLTTEHSMTIFDSDLYMFDIYQDDKSKYPQYFI